MARYIDMDKVTHRLFGVAVSDDTYGIRISQGIDMALKILNEIPTEDVVEVKHGEWDNNGDFYQCSVCDNFTGYNYDYCPYCSAKMDGGKAE